MAVRLVNPMRQTGDTSVAPARRLDSLKGKRVALLDISKPGGSIFLDRLEQLLRDRHAASVVRVSKPTFAKPAPGDVIEQVRGADAVIEALAD